MRSLLTIDKDENYESHSFLMKILHIPLMLCLNILPKTLAQKVFLAFGNTNNDTKVVFSNIATHKALEVMYTWPLRKKEGKTSWIDNFWEKFLSNALAVRNRLVLTKKELTQAINKIKQQKGKINLLSLGSGSARAVIEVIAEMNNNYDLPFKIKLIDLSRDAINFSRELVLKHQLNSELIDYHRDYAQNLEKYYQNDKFTPDIVEMVGLLDYYPEIPAIDLVSKVHKVLSPGGWLITCNISCNFEAPFVTKGINWKLIYRTPEELIEILTKGGFSDSDIKLIYEPMKIHLLAICQKILADP